MSENRVFHEAQSRAVSFGNGPALVVAGPGAGKTTVLIHRIHRLLEAGFAKEEEILVLTFTRAAAAEMRSRFCRLCGKYSTTARFGTFHSFFWWVLVEAGVCTSAQLMGDTIGKQLLMEILGREIEEEEAADRINLISRYRSADEKRRKQLMEILPELPSLVNAYQKVKQDRNILDYDDMEDVLQGLLDRQPEVLLRLREQFRYVLVDEVQDMNQGQYLLLKRLTEEHKNLFMVGDDAQSLYGFRGARPEILERFRKEYHAEVIRLEINYRSCPEIVECAEKLLHRSRHFRNRKICAAVAEHGSVIWNLYSDRKEEAEKIVKRIQEVLSGGTPASEIAVLGRSHRNLLHIEQALQSAEIHNGITITTYHGAKGLEFDMVILPQVNEGCTPDAKAHTREELEEERRMFYVALTRARQVLELSSVRMTGGKYRLPSEFLGDMGILERKKCQCLQEVGISTVKK